MSNSLLIALSKKEGMKNDLVRVIASHTNQPAGWIEDLFKEYGSVDMAIALAMNQRPSQQGGANVRQSFHG